MKKICIALLTLAAALSCRPEAYEKGPKDPEGCYGVYFPRQEGYGTRTIRPSEEHSFTYTVKRVRTDGAITVPVSISAPEGFVVDPIRFADGDAETTFTVHFDNVEQQVEHSFNLEITDPQYASQYALERRYVNFTLMVGNRKITLNHRTDWRFQYYSGYYYVNVCDGYYGFRTVPADDGDPADEAYVQQVIDKYNEELEDHFAGTVPTFRTDYSTAAWALFEGQAHYGATPRSSGAGGKGKYVAFLFGLTAAPYCTGDYQYIELTVE